MINLLDILASNMKKNRSLPFWSWNDRLNINNLISQIDWMKDNGIGGFFMHARSGLITEYLSDEWMECVKACAERAEKLDMEAWLYDENGWPSGFAGGKLLEDPDNHDRYLTYSIGEFCSDSLVSYIITDDELIRSNGKQEGIYLNVYEHLSTSTADVTNPEVVKKFIELTHEKYKEYFGEDFSDKIKGFFTDEPQYFRWDMPYTVMVKKYFENELNEDILDGLGLLFMKKKGYRRFRYLYWSAMQKLLLEGFAKTVYDWCDRNKVKLKGHYIEENTLGYQMMCCGGIMPFYEYEHIPGIDLLSRNCDSPVSSKQVSSVAAQLGKETVICEMYAGSGWDVTPRELKAMTDYLYINGINLTCQHLIPYSERGNRIHDYPPHFSEINPWVKEYFKDFNDYFTRFGALISDSKEMVNVGVLQPIRSTYFDYDRALEDEGFGVSELDGKFLELLKRLEKSAIGYHLLDETILAKYGSVDNSSLICGKCKYDAVVIPDCCTMDYTTEAILREYVLGGGKVLLAGEKPSYLAWEPYLYEYLSSNISWNELEKMRPYNISSAGGSLCASFRTIENEDVLILHNHSAEESCEVSFEESDTLKGFKRVSLVDGKEDYLPLHFTLSADETCVLIPQTELDISVEDYEIVKPDGEYKVISSEDNFITLDMVSYSLNGKNYSEPMCVPMVFKALLEKRFEGKLFLKYAFEVNSIPSQVSINIDMNGIDSVIINGKEFCEISLFANGNNISKWLITGENNIVFVMNYYQSENVYNVLFGENITESLKNCIVYDSEIEPLILKGDFGVYEKNGFTYDAENSVLFGKNFVIAEKFEAVKSLVCDGYPFFAGKITLECDISCTDKPVMLELSGRWHGAKVTVNGKKAGKMLFSNRLDISEFVETGVNKLELELIIGNRNLYGPHHYLPEPEPMMQGPESFEFYDVTEDKSDTYREELAFVEAL